MARITTKLDDRTITVVDEVTETRTAVHTLDDLLLQRLAIQAQKDQDNAQRDQELADVDDLIAQCKALGITVTPIIMSEPPVLVVG